VRLELAGRALDPNGIDSGPDSETAFRLLDEAAVLALGAYLSLPEDGARSELLIAIADSTKLSPWQKQILPRLFDERARPLLDVHDAERVVANIVSALDERDRSSRRRRNLPVAILAAACVIGLGAAFYARVFPARSEAYTWKSSTAYGDYATSGVLGSRRGGLIFHTNEEVNPWVEIDAGKPIAMTTVAITNRADCCIERGIPLTVELAGEDRVFTPVGRRAEEFASWDLVFPPTTARYVRLVASGKTILHLREIQIR
jgi:hypothetical protein